MKTRQKNFKTDNERWVAVAARDTAADGVFYFAVRTTGVYCRPSCASRIARRENVRFFDSCAAAERAGFRPCKRCRPGQEDAQAAAVTAACRAMRAAEELPSLEQLARNAGMTRFHFHRVFKRVSGVTPKAYADAVRAERTREALKKSGSVTEAVYAGGFNSSGRFYAKSEAMLGMPPANYRAHGKGERIRFAAGECSLGAILVAATERGVCCVLLGDDAAELLRDLQDRFPHAELRGGETDFNAWVARAVGAVEDPRKAPELPLDVRGTAFQQRVWQALRTIPYGQTTNYSALAKKLGIPRAVRAVATACAANPVAVAIPCHRVVRIGGGLAGYRWGLARKKELLGREKEKR